MEKRKQAEMVAEHDVELMSNHQIVQIAKAEKKNFLIGTALICACAVVMLIGAISCLLANETGLGVFALVLFSLSTLVLILFFYIIKTRDDKKWAINKIKANYINNPTTLTARLSLLEQDASRVQTVNVSNTIQDNNQDEKILDIFSYNRYLLHRVFIPLFNFAIETGTNLVTICRFAKESYKTAHLQIKKLGDFENILSQQVRRLRGDITYNPNCICDEDIAEQIADDLIATNLNHQLLYISDFPAIKLVELKNSILSLLNRNPDAKPLVKCYLDSQVKIALLKLFVFEKELSNIHENEELLKILTNAAFKYQNLDIIAERTYELFLDYYELQKHQFSFDSYTELMRVFFATKQSCNEFYKSEEMAFDFDVSLLSIEEIASKIISEKLYKKYDVDKLMVSLLYEKADDFTTLLDFIKELNSIDSKCERIKKAATKDDLLNGEYTSRKTFIVDVDLMTGVEFEEFLCNYFNTHGYVCTQTKASGDQGIDLVAKKDDYVLAIQAKCYTGTVGNHAIMEAVAGTKYYNANQTMVITNSTFTKSAVELAAVNNVILWDRQVLIEKLANS